MGCMWWLPCPSSCARLENKPADAPFAAGSCHYRTLLAIRDRGLGFSFPDLLPRGSGRINTNSWILSRRIWLRNLLLAFTQLALLGVAIWACYWHIGGWNTGVTLFIAMIICIIGLLFYMGLIGGNVLFRLTVAGAAFFIVVMFVFTLSDYFTRIT